MDETTHQPWSRWLRVTSSSKCALLMLFHTSYRYIRSHDMFSGLIHSEIWSIQGFSTFEFCENFITLLLLLPTSQVPSPKAWMIFSGSAIRLVSSLLHRRVSPAMPRACSYPKALDTLSNPVFREYMHIVRWFGCGLSHQHAVNRVYMLSDHISGMKWPGGPC